MQKFNGSMDRQRWEVQRQQLSGWVVRQLDQDSETKQCQVGKNRTKRWTLEGDEIAERKRNYNRTIPKRRLSWERLGSENQKNFGNFRNIFKAWKNQRKPPQKLEQINIRIWFWSQDNIYIRKKKGKNT